MLTKENTVLVIIDVQGKLAKIVQQSEEMLDQLANLIQACHILEIPILWLEQYPQGLGPTDPKIAQHLTGLEPISKITFSACGNEQFMEQLQKVNRKQVLLTGIETHICVYQTGVDLVAQGYEVQVVSDAVSSRTAENKRIGLEKMKAAGIAETSVEMAVYEMLQKAGGEQFKAILKLFK